MSLGQCVVGGRFNIGLTVILNLNHVVYNDGGFKLCTNTCYDVQYLYVQYLVSIFWGGKRNIKKYIVSYCIASYCTESLVWYFPFFDTVYGIFQNQNFFTRHVSTIKNTLTNGSVMASNTAAVL